VGTIDALREHLITCPFTLLPCPKQCKDEQKRIKVVMKRDLGEHLQKHCPNRDFICENCGEEGTYAGIMEMHDKKCAKKVVSCTNDGCAKVMPHKELADHIQECVYTMIDCKYKNIGCSAKLSKKDIAAHQADANFHFPLAVDTTIKLKQEVAALKRVTLKAGEAFTFKVTEFQRKKDNDIMYISPSFYSSPQGYHMVVMVCVNGQGDSRGKYMSIFGKIRSGRFDTTLVWPLVGDLHIAVLNHLEDKHYERVIPQFNMQVGKARGYTRFIVVGPLQETPKSNQPGRWRLCLALGTTVSTTASHRRGV